MEPNFGTGQNLLGNTDAIKEAMARRGVDMSVLQGVSSSSPNFMQVPQAPQGPSMPPQGAPMDMSQQPAQPPLQMPQAPSIPQMGQPLPQGQSDSEIILNALSARLKSDSKIKEAQNIPQVPTI